MARIKPVLVNLKGFFKKRTTTQRVLNRAHIQEYFSAIFGIGLTKIGPLFIAYQPDSHYTFQDHPEFHKLFKKFRKHNRSGNGGDIVRLWSFILNCKQVLSEGIEGDFAELGVWRGNTASVLAEYASKSNRIVYLFDTFEGFSKLDIQGVDANKDIVFNNTSIELVKKNIAENDSSCKYIKGFFPDTITEEHKSKKYAIVSLDCDLYAPTKAGLEFFYPRMSNGGIFFLHDYSSLHWKGCKQAIDEFCSEKGIRIILMPDKSGSAFFRK